MQAAVTCLHVFGFVRKGKTRALFQDLKWIGSSE
jgi:hypothetical protein